MRPYEDDSGRVVTLVESGMAQLNTAPHAYMEDIDGFPPVLVQLTMQRVLKAETFQDDSGKHRPRRLSRSLKVSVVCFFHVVSRCDQKDARRTPSCAKTLKRAAKGSATKARPKELTPTHQNTILCNETHCDSDSKLKDR